MSKPEILVTDRFIPVVLDGLNSAFVTHELWKADDPEAVLSSVAGNIRGIAAGHTIPFNADFIDRFPNLEIIANFGVGYDNIDAAYAATRNILVTNTPDVLTEEVADTAIGLMIMTARELSASERWLRAGNWNGPYPLTRGTLRGKKLGIFGLGRIGKAIARRAEAMLMEVSYHNRNPLADVDYRYFATLTELAAHCDVLLCAAPGGPATRHIINTDIFKALGPEGMFINIGRGSTVDETALIEALQNETIMTAGLDVFEFEPKVPQALIDMDHVVLLPHVASASQHTRDAMGQLQVDNLTHWFKNGAPITPVAETPWPRS
ncbi:2-hydroxyacid dehydrogenase [Hoeflea sp. TYP-13]|uniref:2-hydroxyacid dehydrogenase n=1 Tax=Hoeflea sp. TYP-13 TaxID=3230023 RepID=UPI0034C6CD8D